MTTATPRSTLKRPTVVPITPSPPASLMDDGEDAQLVIGPSFLDRLLTVMELDNDEADAVTNLLTGLGIRKAHELALFEKEDCEGSTLSRICQRKLLLVVDYLSRGYALEQAKSWPEIARLLRESSTAASTKKKQSKSIVSLNVGGKQFSTSTATLARVEGSVLEAIVSGRHQHAARQDHDGNLFIDRDRTHFEHILNFLRVGSVVTLPSEQDSKEALAIEADYYGLPQLAKAIRLPVLHIDDYLDEEVKIFRHEEQSIRDALANGDGALIEPCAGLLPLFRLEGALMTCDSFASNPIIYEPPSKTSNVHISMDNLRESKKSAGMRVTSQHQHTFMSNMNMLHPNMLNRLNSILLEENLLIAGGAVLHALTRAEFCRTSEWWGDTGDIDLFLYGVTRTEADRIARRVWTALAADMEQWVIVRSGGVINMHKFLNRVIEQKLQLVLRLYESPAEVLLGFDCDCCCCAYDGRQVWVSPRWVYAMKHGINTLNPLHSWPNRASYELRLAKYARRGFAVAVPGLNMSRLDLDIIHKTKPDQDLKSVKGMARFLKIAFAIEGHPPDGQP